MNANKYIFILVVALFAVAAISAFGAQSKDKISTAANKIAPSPAQDLNRAISQLNNPSRAVVAGAVKDLALMHTEAATQALISYIKTSRDDYMRIQVIEVLAVNPSTSTAQALIDSARDPNPFVRKAAIKSLGFRTDAESLPELKRALSQDNDPGVKKFALQSLSLHKSSAAIEAVSGVLADKSNKELRVMAAHALKRINTQASRNVLDKYKNDSDVAVRNEANQGQVVNQVKPKKGK
jgi:HEAT repeat protein